MKERRAVGTNLKSYYYYTNEMADRNDAIACMIIAVGMEGSGELYDEVGDYLDRKGIALYAVEAAGYGKTGKITKDIYKNWKSKDFHFSAYNLHALAHMVKKGHPDTPVYLIGNDFGSMESLYLVNRFPEVVDKVVNIGWGAKTGQDVSFFTTSLLRKIFFYDNSPSKYGHHAKNRLLALRFESKEKYAWLTRDREQLEKLKNGKYLDTPGTIGHYYYYYLNKIRSYRVGKKSEANKEMPILFLSGVDDVSTHHGRTTRALAAYYKNKGFKNIDFKLVEGRHQLLFETNRERILNLIIAWCMGKDLNAKKTPSKKINQYEVEIVGEVDKSFHEESKDHLRIDREE